MTGDFPDDTFTENDVLACLESAGLRFKRGNRYILSQCPTHDDENPSVQIYKDDWFVNCHAGCGRYHITKAFPELRPTRDGNTEGFRPANGRDENISSTRKASAMTQHVYKQFDLMDYWKALPLIPRDHKFKTIPLDILDDLGWRWVENNNQYFIPYFSRSKETIPFAQYRNLGDGPRFIFLKDAKPTCYGTWNLIPGSKLFICEGASDAAVLDYCGVPWIALPSAASKTLMQSMAKFAVQNDIGLVYAGDNDDAGNKLLEALDEVAPYRIKQPPKEYKDWGDFLVGAGFEVVRDYAHRELFPPPIDTSDPNIPIGIRELWPDAKMIEVGEPHDSKEQSAVLPLEF